LERANFIALPFKREKPKARYFVASRKLPHAGGFGTKQRAFGPSLIQRCVWSSLPLRNGTVIIALHAGDGKGSCAFDHEHLINSSAGTNRHLGTIARAELSPAHETAPFFFKARRWHRTPFGLLRAKCRMISRKLGETPVK
jgi:hypothetical protein